MSSIGRERVVVRDDPRLARLYDYTKFHIGIYITAGTTMTTVLAAKDQSGFLGALVKHPLLLLLAVISMGIAGAAGGIIVSWCATAKTFKAVWDDPIGAWGINMPGCRWAWIEHRAFWASIILFGSAVLVPRL